MRRALRQMSKILSMILAVCVTGAIAAPAAYGAAEDGQVSFKKVRATSMIRKDGRQETEAALQNSGRPFTGYAKITVGKDRAYIAELGEIKTGEQTVILPVTDTHDALAPGQTTTLKVELYDNAGATGDPKGTYENGTWERTRHWEVYLCQEMHTDLGYTQYQEALKDTFSGYLDTVKAYMENSDNRSADLEKYKYAIESGFMLGEGYMTRRTADDLQWIVDRVKEGRMEIGAGQFNYTVENFSTEEAARATYYSKRFLADKLGVAISKTQRMFDNPAFSKGYVDFAVESGIKYGMHSMNPDRSPYHQKRQYDLFYMQGNNPENRLLIFNGKAYSENYGFGGSHFSPEGNVNAADTAVLQLFRELEARSGRNAYPYDKFPMALVPYGDNQRPMEDQIIVANGLNKKWSEEGYAYPRIKTAFPDEFFEDVEAEYGDMIPVETGTEENWWNDGWGTTAYESGVNKQAGALIPVAETAASFASLFAGAKYPYTDLYEAYERNLTYDEHTWGAAGYDDGNADYHNQFEWKRSNAFAAKNLAGKALSGSLDALASTVPTEGQAVYVYNPLNWERDDVVTVTDLTGFPEYFLIKDGGTSIPYTVEDGKLTFIAPRVPALGYKTFTVESVAAAPAFTSKVKAEGKTVENAYYKVTFGDDGTIASILDKQNGGRELVDGAAGIGFNQYQYYDDHGIPFANQGADFGADKWTLYTPDAAAGRLTLEGKAVGVTACLDTSAFRADSIVQKVTLYNDLPRIDIENTVVKTPLPSVQDKEEAFYTFPFQAGADYEIRYDLPAGSAAEGEQVYGTSTDWYTAGKWVNVQDGDGYNMTLAIPDTSLVQFGERRTGSWSFDYKSEKPYIYSYVMNNMWQTNFQGDQPGAVTFTYALSSNKSAGMSDTARFGWEVSYPLQAAVIGGPQQGSAKTADSYLTVDSENVQLTTMKTAEANGEGMILRFHEITGSPAGQVTVTLPFEAQSVTETNVIEEDKGQVAGKGSSFTFTLGAYGVKTFRVRFAAAPAAVEGLTAVTTAESTLENLSARAKAAASSEYSGEYAASNALSLANGKDWAANGQTRATIRLTWDSDVQIGSFALADRPNGVDNVQSATVTFSDGSQVEVTDIDPAGKVKTISLEEEKTVRWAEVEIRCDKPSNIGLSGLEFYAAGGQAAAAEGTQLTWTAQDDALYYEIFRSTDPDFAAGSGSYLASACRNQYFDAQVPGGLTRTYYYKVRAVAAGAKGAASAAVRQQPEGGGETGQTQLVTPVDAIAGSQYSDQRPTLIIDGSGLTGEGLTALHDNDGNAFTMWHTDGNPGENAWVQIDFDRAYPLDEMWVWNMNQNNNTGRGLKNVRIQYTADGVVWQDLQPEEGMTFADGSQDYPFQLARASGQDGMSATNLNDGANTPIRFGGALAKHVKITAHPDAGTGSWGDVYYGLSEVRFTRQPAPQSGLTVEDTAPEAPVVNASPRLGDRVDLDWAPVCDDVKLDHYEVYRNGALIGKTLDAYICTYRDKTAAPNTAYTYVVKAVDAAGNAAESAPVRVRTPDSLAAALSSLTLSMGTLTPGFSPETRFYTVNLGDNFGRFDGVKVTVTAVNPAATIYVNGVETAGGAESALVPLQAPGDKIVIKVTEGEVSKSYILTAGTGAPILTAVNAEAGSQFDSQKPELLIDGSGLTGKGLDAVHDNHSSAFTMWHTDNNPGERAWVQIDLGQPCALDEMWVWNMNQSGNTGRGLKNVKIEYSADGKSWQALEPEAGMTFADSPAGYPFQLAQASGQNDQPATNLNDGKNTPVRFGGAVARYVKITAHPQAGTGSWGDSYYGLSEVRFTSKLDLRDIVAAESIEVRGQDGKRIITTPGGSLQMTAAIQPDNATRQDVVWSLANPEENVAMVSADGLLTARSNGSAEVVATAKDGSGVTGRCTVTVSGQPTVITGVRAEAGDVYDEHNTPEKVVNGAGMSGQNSVFDLHDDHGNGNTMWHTKAGPGEDAWIVFDLGRVQTIGQMWIWNMNQRGNADRGLKKVKIEYRGSLDEDWTALKGTGEGEYDFTLAKASGQPDQPATNLMDGRPVEMNLDARYVRITAAPQPGEGNYGSDYYGLSEVRFTAGGSGQAGELLRQALEAADAAVKELPLSNATGADEILKAARQAVASTGVSVEWQETLILKPATAAETGSLTGSLALTLEGESLTLPVQLEIPAVVKPGDLDKDGEVTIQDVMEACKVLARQSAGKAPAEDEMLRGNLDGDDKFTIGDVMEICKILARKA